MNIIPFPETQQGCSCKAPEWLSLPVVPQASARSRFSGDKKLSQAIPLQGALTWISDLTTQGKGISGLNIDGPGDPLATLPMTLDILSILHEKYPDLPIGLKTLGFGLAENIEHFAELGIEKVTLFVDGISAETIQNLYTWIRPGKKNIPLAKAADILILEQKKGISACKEAGIDIVVQTTVYTGVNEMEVEAISDEVSQLGVETMILRPGHGVFQNGEILEPLTVDGMEWLAMKAGGHIRSVCVEMPQSGGEIIPISGAEKIPVKPTTARPNIAVLSSNGMDIDLHLGQAIKALIYGPREDGLACLLETRDLPEAGSGDNRWLQLAETLQDCFALLAASAGQKPRDILGRNGIPILLIEDNVEGTVDALYGGGKKGKKKGL